MNLENIDWVVVNEILSVLWRGDEAFSIELDDEDQPTRVSQILINSYLTRADLPETKMLTNEELSTILMWFNWVDTVEPTLLSSSIKVGDVTLGEAHVHNPYFREMELLYPRKSPYQILTRPSSIRIY